MLEKEIEKKVCDYAKTKEAAVFKFTSPARRNVPDRLLVFPGGHPLFIEFKAKGKKPTAGQEREIKRLRDLQVAVLVVDNVEEGKELIDQFVERYCENT